MAISFVAYRDNGLTAAGNTDGTITVDLSTTGWQDGDLILLAGTRDASGGGGVAWSDPAAPDRFTLIVDHLNALGTDIRSTVWWDFLATGDSDTVTMQCGQTGKAVSLSATILRGVDPATPFDVTFVSADHFTEGVDDSTPTNDPITTLTNGAAVTLYHFTSHNEITSPGAAPTNYSLVGSETSGGGRNQFTAVRAIATAGTETPGPWTHTTTGSAGDFIVITLAIRPSTGVTIAGSLLTRTPSFFAGTLSASITTAGVLLSRAPTFPQGALNAQNTISGVLLSRAPSFPTGSLTSQSTIAGALLSVAPSFPVGVLTPGAGTITGTLLSVSPSFGSGAVNAENTVSGALLLVLPSFPIGSATAEITTSGVLLSIAPSFPLGSLTAEATIGGVLLSVAPSFPAGAASAGGEITGGLLTVSPVFGVGALTSEITASGVLLSVVPSFPPGSLSAGSALTGVLFSVAPSFFVGSLNSETSLGGVSLIVVPSFPGGAVSLSTGPQTIVGLLYTVTPSFPQGSVSLFVAQISTAVLVSARPRAVAMGRTRGARSGTRSRATVRR